jgi:hypothetical protein
MSTVNFATMSDMEFVQLVHSLYNVRGNGVSTEVRTITNVYGDKYTASVEIADNGELCNGVIMNWRGEDVTVWLASSQF